MEDSRNIIKAIDALTLKAGGEVVDSKNITEAIDRLKEVYSEQAIGIDKTLSREGLAADAKAVGDANKELASKAFSTFFKYYTKSTKGSIGTVQFNCNGNRYSGILFVCNNSGQCAIYSVLFKAGINKISVKIAGDESHAITIDDTGTIGVPLSEWSTAVLLTVTDGHDFS